MSDVAVIDVCVNDVVGNDVFDGDLTHGSLVLIPASIFGGFPGVLVGSTATELGCWEPGGTGSVDFTTSVAGVRGLICTTTRPVSVAG